MKRTAVGSLSFAWGTRTFVMAIINATPDSFSGDGILATSRDAPDMAVQRAVQAVAEGADILDVGAMSTRPNAPLVSETEEMDRLLPTLQAIRQALPDIPLSVDTYRGSVVRAAFPFGISLVNSVWGIRSVPGEEEDSADDWNHDLIIATAESCASLVLTHNGRTSAMAGTGKYQDIANAVRQDLAQQAEFAIGQGIPRESLVIDPGFGFGKTYTDNLTLLRRVGELRSLGLPLLIGTSRKSFVGKLLGDIPTAERDAGTAATTAWVIAQGADMVRVHNVKMNASVTRVTDALHRDITSE